MKERAQDPEHAENAEAVELTFPASVDLVVLARFTAATVAARAGFDVDEIEDLRLAVDELCVSFGPLEMHDTVRLRFERTDGTVRITGEFDGSGTRSPDAIIGTSDPLSAKRAEAFSRQLLAALVDDHGLEQANGRQVAWLQKRRGSDYA
jgi:anti-sigma regulatory factor (Ser/Thr protein kinase)